MAHGSGKFVLRVGAGAIIKNARVARELHRYQLGELLGFSNRRSAQDFVTRLEHDELAGDTGATAMGHVINACGILGIPFDAVAQWVLVA